MSHTSFLDRVSTSTIRYADRPALACGEVSVKYAELARIVNGIRQLVRDEIAVTPERIGIVTSDDVETYASLLATWSLGAAYVPLNSNNPVERNARIIEQANLDVILTCRARNEWPKHLPTSGSTVKVISTSKATSRDDRLRFPNCDPGDLAYIFFTSGSTGTPKGVPISHENLSAFMDVMLTSAGQDFSADDRFLQMFELTFDLSVVSIVAPWSVGACCCVVPEKGISYLNILNVLTASRVTVALMVPSVLPYLQRFFDEIRLPSLRLSQFCGEALIQDMVAQWSDCVPNAAIENVYGPTEATIYCTRYPWDRDRAEAESVHGVVPIGRPLPGVWAEVVDEQGRRCSPGTEGELCLAGSQVMSGYWKDRDTTARSFITVAGGDSTLQAYRTGDLAYQSPNGNLIFRGRKDSQVKIDGHRIELGEIEFHARQFVGHSSAAVTASADASGFARLTLYVGGEGIDRKALEDYLIKNLPHYMRPSSVIVLPELPLNLNGKIDRRALNELKVEAPDLP